MVNHNRCDQPTVAITVTNRCDQILRLCMINYSYLCLFLVNHIYGYLWFTRLLVSFDYFRLTIFMIIYDVPYRCWFKIHLIDGYLWGTIFVVIMVNHVYDYLCFLINKHNHWKPKFRAKNNGYFQLWSNWNEVKTISWIVLWNKKFMFSIHISFCWCNESNA